MLNNQQNQKAGDGSHLIQTEILNIYNGGINEERARLIVDERLQEVLNNYSEESRELATQRVNEFAEELIPKLVKENLLETLADPSVQILLMDTQKTAASTERKSDYSLLSELLIHRVKHGSDRYVRSGVNRAIKIVDEISDEALLGLTVVYSIMNFDPNAVDLDDALTILNNMFKRIMYDELPKEKWWLEQLDVVNAVRIESFGRLKPLEQVYTSRLSFFVDVGIERNSEEYHEMKEIITKMRLPENIVVDHELRKEYVRLAVDINKLDTVVLSQIVPCVRNGIIENKKIDFYLSEQQKEAINTIHSLYKTDDSLKNENIDTFMKKMRLYDSLKVIEKWWDSIEIPFSITSVGRVLAHANAQRCDSSLPNLD